MELHLHSVGLLPHAFKCGFAQAQYSEALPLKLTQAPAVQLSILVITSHSIDVVPLQKACGPPHPALLGHCAADVVDRYQMSPGDGKPGVVDKLANEALQSLLELKSLADQVKQARGKLAGLVSHSWEREQLAPTLAELSKVQCETETSIELSGRVIRSHGDFCRYMHETLQHAAAERDHHLAQDSSVIVAGSVVIDSLTVLGKHVMAVQGALHDVAREFRDLGEKAHHRVKHPLIHHLWKKIWPVLIDVVKMTMLVISCIGKVLGLFHPVASIIGEGAGRVHKYFDEHFSNCIHGHNMDPPPGEHDDVLEILQSLCDDMPKHIQHVQDLLKDCFISIEKPMLEVQEQLKAHYIRVDKQDAQDAASMWGELRERLDEVVKTHCQA